MQKPLNKLLNYGDVSCSSNIWVCGLLKCKYSKETWWFAPTFKWWYLLCVLCKQLLVFNLQMKFHGCMSMHMEPLHLFFHVILYTKTNRVLLITHKALTSEPVEDFPWFDHSKNNNKKLIQQYYHMFRFIIQRDLTFEPMAKILRCVTMQIKPLLPYFTRYYLIFHTHESKRFKKDLNWCLT